MIVYRTFLSHSQLPGILSSHPRRSSTLGMSLQFSQLFGNCREAKKHGFCDTFFLSRDAYFTMCKVSATTSDRKVTLGSIKDPRCVYCSIPMFLFPCFHSPGSIPMFPFPWFHSYISIFHSMLPVMISSPCFIVPCFHIHSMVPFPCFHSPGSIPMFPFLFQAVPLSATCYSQ